MNMSLKGPNNSHFEPILPRNKKLIIYELYFFGGVAAMVNIFTILVISKIRGPLSSNIRLLCSLLMADFCTALIIVVDQIINDLQIDSSYNCIAPIVYSLKCTCQNAIILTLTCLAVDLYIAIIHALNYTTYMSGRKINILLISIWLASILLGFPALYLTTRKDCENINIPNNYCTFRPNCALLQCGWIPMAMLPVAICILIYIYMKVFLKIRDLNEETHRLNRNSTGRNRRGLATTMIVLITFLIFYAPYNISQIISINFSESFEDNRWLLLLMIFNSIFDPILYAFRMRDIRKGFKNLFCFINCPSIISTIRSRHSSTSLSGSHRHAFSPRQNPATHSWSSHYTPRGNTSLLAESSTHSSTRKFPMHSEPNNSRHSHAEVLLRNPICKKRSHSVVLFKSTYNESAIE